MINPVNTNPIPQNNRIKHKKLVSATGYAAMGFGTICGVTGLKSVKFPHKMNVHKYSAWLAAFSTVLHLGITKGFDRIFNKS